MPSVDGPGWLEGSFWLAKSISFVWSGCTHFSSAPTLSFSARLCDLIGVLNVWRCFGSLYPCHEPWGNTPKKKNGRSCNPTPICDSMSFRQCRAARQLGYNDANVVFTAAYSSFFLDDDRPSLSLTRSNTQRRSTETKMWSQTWIFSFLPMGTERRWGSFASLSSASLFSGVPLSIFFFLFLSKKRKKGQPN